MGGSCLSLLQTEGICSVGQKDVTASLVHAVTLVAERWPGRGVLRDSSPQSAWLMSLPCRLWELERLQPAPAHSPAVQAVLLLPSPPGAVRLSG